MFYQNNQMINDYLFMLTKSFLLFLKIDKWMNYLKYLWISSDESSIISSSMTLGKNKYIIENKSKDHIMNL